MVEVRAYAVAVTEVRGLAGAAPDDRPRLRALARARSDVPPLRTRDLLGPIHCRVPGAPLVRDDEPAAYDLEVLLDGGPVPADRVAASWHLVERLVAGLSLGTTRLAEADLPPGLLVPVGLPLPQADGPGAAWCTRTAAETVEALRRWLLGFDGLNGWRAAAERAGRAAPDVVVLSGPA